jgi:CHAT domain-containing protein
VAPGGPAADPQASQSPMTWPLATPLGTFGTPALPDRGIAGLRQAFLMAGAENVLATLWSIDDETTVELVDAFFTALKTSPTPAAALREAQLKQIARRRALCGYAHPYYWAPFTVMTK